MDDLASLFFADDEDDQRARAMALAQALRGQQSMGLLGQLTGDRVLGNVGTGMLGRAQQGQEQIAQVGKFRLQKALEAQKEMARRKMELEDVAASQKFTLSRDAASDAREGKRNTRELAEALAAEERKHLRDLELAKIAGGQKTSLTLESDLQELSKRLPPEATPLKQRLDRLEGVMGTEGDIPGVGPLEGKIPDLLTFGKGETVRSDLNGVVSTMLAIQSGKAVSEGEIQRKKAELGLADGQSEDALRTGMKNLREEIALTLEQKQAGFRPEVVGEYRKRGGMVGEAIRERPGSATEKVGTDGNTYFLKPNGKWAVKK